MIKFALSKCGNFVNFINTEPAVSVSTIAAGDFKNLDQSRQRPMLGKCLSHIGADTFVHIKPNHGTIISPFDSAMASNKMINADSLMYGDYEKGCLSLIHCSYITLSKQIIEKSIDALKAWTLLDLGRLKALIYGGICQDCYEVDLAVYELFGNIIARNKKLGEYFKKGRKNHFQLDLAGYIKEILLYLGFDQKNIQTAHICSACMRKHHLQPKNIFDDSRLFFSYRKFNDKERNLIFAKLPNDTIMLSATTGNCPYLILYSTAS